MSPGPSCLLGQRKPRASQLVCLRELVWDCPAQNILASGVICRVCQLRELCFTDEAVCHAWLCLRMTATCSIAMQIAELQEDVSRRREEQAQQASLIEQLRADADVQDAEAAAMKQAIAAQLDELVRGAASYERDACNIGAGVL